LRARRILFQARRFCALQSDRIRTASALAGLFLNLFRWACKEFPILRAPQFGSIIDVLRHVLNRRLDPQCAKVLMTYFKK
jgi:hypothetical protein